MAKLIKKCRKKIILMGKNIKYRNHWYVGLEGISFLDGGLTIAVYFITLHDVYNTVSVAQINQQLIITCIIIKVVVINCMPLVT